MLIAFIKKWILPGTTILSDCWKGYSTLAAEGYVHQTVNHSIIFVSNTGVHQYNRKLLEFTEKIVTEIWHIQSSIQLLFCGVLHAPQILDSSTDKFLQFLHIIGLAYKPKQLHRPTDAHFQCGPAHCSCTGTIG